MKRLLKVKNIIEQLYLMMKGEIEAIRCQSSLHKACIVSNDSLSTEHVNNLELD